MAIESGSPGQGNSNERVVKQHPEKREIHRASVIDEIWVVQEGKTPRIFLSLLHKRSKNWWEKVGGTIDEAVNEQSIVETAKREREEEAPTRTTPILEQSVRLLSDPHQDLRRDLMYLSGHPREVVERILAGVNSYPLVLRRVYTHLPELVLGSSEDAPERQEHDDYRLLDMSDPYFSWNYGVLHKYMKSAMRNAVIDHDPVRFIPDEHNPRIIRLKDPSSHYRPTLERLNLSQSCVANLLMYVQMQNRLTNGAPYNRKGELKNDFRTDRVLDPVRGYPTERS